MSCQSVSPWKDAPAALCSAVICFSSCVVWSSVLVMKDRAEVCPLAREVMFQLLSVPLQDGLRFFRIPPSPFGTPCGFLPDIGRTEGLPCSEQVTKWVRFALFAGGVACPRGRRSETCFPPQCPFGSSHSAS